MNIILTKEERVRVSDSKKLFPVLKAILLRQDEIDQDREHFWVIGLNNANWILFIELISLGTVKATHADPMDVFSFALQKRAVKIILAHNHPSGDLSPSEEDLDITDRLIQVGKIVNTPVLDHLIITPDKYYSFGDEGDMARLALSTKWEPTFITIERTREQAERIGRELGREEGLAEGEKKGQAEGEKIGAERGRKEGEEIGMQKGEQIGAERGRKEGAERERRAVAAEMRRKGIAVDTICEITGLSKQEIEQIS